MMDSGAVAALTVTFVSGGLVQYLIGLYFDRRRRAADTKKILAEAENIEVDTALKLVVSLSKRVECLERELKQERDNRAELDKKYLIMNREVGILREREGVLIRGVYALVEQVKCEMGKEPVFTPPKDW
jgi:malate synthase